MRSAPSIKFSKRFYDAAFLVSGYDTIEESASVFIFDRTWDALEQAKQYARDRNTGNNQAYSTRFCGLEMQIKPHGGSGGAVFILSNPDFTITIRAAEVPYNISVAYRSRFLWQPDMEQKRRELWDRLLQEMKPRPPEKENPDSDIYGWRKISRVDYAFDFHSPEFTTEIGPGLMERFVCHSSCKARWDFKVQEEGEELDAYIMGTSTRVQTLTVGKKNSLQVQVYKKSDEITEKSGKTWMYRLWEKAGLEPDEDGKHDDVWRIELRFGREYLRAREVIEFADFQARRDELVSEALQKRRLTDRTKDTNRRRWPVHPMWGQAIELAGNAQQYIELNGYKEQAPDAIKARILQNLKAGMRQLSVLETGGDEYDWVTVHNLLEEVKAEIEADENHIEKMEEYGERYKYAHEPI